MGLNLEAVASLLEDMIARGDEARRKGYLAGRDIVDAGMNLADFEEVWFGLGWYRPKGSVH